MRHLLSGPIACLVLLATVSGVQAGERAKAEVDCTATDQKHVYDCKVMLLGRKSGLPMDGAKLVVGADMPSMPMVHNIKPVAAMPTGEAGLYHARIELQMYGEWALTLDVSGPTRDKLIHKANFTGPAGEGASQAMQHGEHKMDQGGMKMEEGAEAPKSE